MAQIIKHPATPPRPTLRAFIPAELVDELKEVAKRAKVGLHFEPNKDGDVEVEFFGATPLRIVSAFETEPDLFGYVREAYDRDRAVRMVWAAVDNLGWQAAYFAAIATLDLGGGDPDAASLLVSELADGIAWDLKDRDEPDPNAEKLVAGLRGLLGRSTPPRRSAGAPIATFFLCALCEDERPAIVSSQEFARTQAGLTPDGLLQVFCNRHQKPIIDVELEPMNPVLELLGRCGHEHQHGHPKPELPS
jgi:hypothetical protein